MTQVSLGVKLRDGRTGKLLGAKKRRALRVTVRVSGRRQALAFSLRPSLATESVRGRLVGLRFAETSSLSRGNLTPLFAGLRFTVGSSLRVSVTRARSLGRRAEAVVREARPAGAQRVRGPARRPSGLPEDHLGPRPQSSRAAAWASRCTIWSRAGSPKVSRARASRDFAAVVGALGLLDDGAPQAGDEQQELAVGGEAPRAGLDRVDDPQPVGGRARRAGRSTRRSS